jgi:hypothetical protein
MSAFTQKRGAKLGAAPWSSHWRHASLATQAWQRRNAVGYRNSSRARTPGPKSIPRLAIISCRRTEFSHLGSGDMICLRLPGTAIDTDRFAVSFDSGQKEIKKTKDMAGRTVIP